MLAFLKPLRGWSLSKDQVQAFSQVTSRVNHSPRWSKTWFARIVRDFKCLSSANAAVATKSCDYLGPRLLANLYWRSIVHLAPRFYFWGTAKSENRLKFQSKSCPATTYRKHKPAGYKCSSIGYFWFESLNTARPREPGILALRTWKTSTVLVQSESRS